MNQRRRTGKAQGNMAMLCRTTGRFASSFGMMLVIGVAWQLLVPIALPSVTVAFLDGGLFRNWSGFGLIETFTQAVMLAILLPLCIQYTTKFGEGKHTPQQVLMVMAIFAVGAIPCWLIMLQAVRLPALVVATWGIETALQVLAGCLAITWVGIECKRMAIATAGSVFLLVPLLALGFYWPAPLPDETLTIAGPNGTRVAVDCFLPAAAGPHPAVIILHGVEGATELSRRVVHYPNARAIRDKGLATFFVRYFDASPYQHLMLMKDGLLDVEQVERIRLRDYQGWVDIACNAMREVESREDVDRLAVVGYSLGCYVGSAAVARGVAAENPCVFVGNFGGIWPEVDVGPNFPPTRFYHGEDDTVVSVEVARQAVKKLRASGNDEVELFVYPGQGHVPEGPTSSVIRLSTEDFLLKHLLDGHDSHHLD